MAKKKSTVQKKEVQTQPDVSLLMPVYNGIVNYPEGRLRRAIDTALQSNGVTVELCVVNDGSTDETVKILESYGSDIKLAHSKARVGAGDATNMAAEMATGRYFMQYSARAWLEPDGLNRLVGTLDKHSNAGFAYGMMRVEGVINRLHIPEPYKRQALIDNFTANFFMFRSEAFTKHDCRFRDYVDLKENGKVGVVDRDFMMQMMINLGWDGVANTDGVIVHYYYSGVNQGSVVLAQYRHHVMSKFDEYWKGAK